MEETTFKHYVNSQIERLGKEDTQIAWDRIRDYNELLEAGIFRTGVGVKTLRTFKKGDVVHIVDGYVKEGDKFARDVIVDDMGSSNRPNVDYVDGKFIALRDIGEGEELKANWTRILREDV